MDEGRYPEAIEKLKLANSLFGGTNAQTLNYLGLAYHQVGEAAEAEKAYQRALGQDRDLSEARFNLGCLWLAQNRLDAAKAAFTAYTLGQRAAPEGFVKLGMAQLRLRDTGAAEKSFSEALRLHPQNPEALNGLGLARLQRGRAAEAAQCFEGALRQQPGYRPALLNLAIVAHQHLKDHRMALQKYREYLALKPPAGDADVLAATVRQLEEELNPSARRPATNAVAQPKPPAPSPRPTATNVTRVASAPRPEAAPAAPKPPPANAAKPATTNLRKPPVAPTTAPPPRVKVVKLPEEPVIRQAQDLPATPAPAQASSAQPLATTSSVPASAAQPKVAKRGFFQQVNPLNLFRRSEKTPMQPTPLEPRPASSQPEAARIAAAAAAPGAATHAPPAPKGSPGRYAYKSPTKPAPGNRADAERSFAQGVQAHQAHRLPEAMQAYRLSAQLDPSFFDAYYQLGLAATQAGNLTAALTAYESALAVQPTSLDARYNFALVLKQANYLADAVNELERVLASYPNESRAHLALGNLCAQQLGRPAEARKHYLKVLEVEPRHPQASAIRFWLAAHPP